MAVDEGHMVEVPVIGDLVGRVSVVSVVVVDTGAGEEVEVDAAVVCVLVADEDRGNGFA